MDTYSFNDAIAQSSVSCTFPGLEAVSVFGGDDLADCESVFFPGCSFINYAMPLMQSVYELLVDAGQVDGISLLCCGEILGYEGDGGALRAAYEQQFREHIAKTKIKRIVTACPNCPPSLRKILAADEATADIEVVPLPRVLADLGYRIDPTSAEELLRQNGDLPDGEEPVFCPKDSCPDRSRGEYADALRELMSETNLVEPKFARKRSYCCGSRPRAVGHFELANKQACRNGVHAREVGANVIVTACVNCSFSLVAFQNEVPVYHYLELLFNWRIPWYLAEGYIKLRFLFDDAEANRSSRDYKGLDS